MKSFALFAVLLTASVAVGQSMTSSGSGTWNAPAMISNFPDCTTGGVNCWHDMKTTAAKIFADDQTYKIDSSCNVSSYNEPPTNTWTAHPEYGCVQVMHNVNGVLYGLVHSQGAAGYALSTWSGTTWTDISCCFVDFSVAPDGKGLLVAHDPNGTIWTSKDGGHTFSSQAWCNPYPVSSEAAIALDSSNNPVFAVACQNNTIWRFGSGNWAQLPGSAQQIAVNIDGDMYMLDLNGHVNHWNTSNGGAWETLVGNIGFMAVGGPMSVWGLSGSNLYRFSEMGVEWSRTYSGSVTCKVPPPYGQQICPTFHHTASLQICTQKKCGAVAAAPPWNNSGTWSLTSKVHTNDLFDCILNAPDPSDCQVLENAGAMQCSSGANNNDNPGSPSFGVAIDVQRWTGNISSKAPQDLGNGVTGMWFADLTQATTEACSVGTPTCRGSGRQYTAFTYPYHSTPEWYLMEEEIYRMLGIYITGAPSPWVYYVPWVRYSDNGPVTCAPFTGNFNGGIPKWGKLWEVPPCR